MSRPISSESVYRAIAHPTRRRILELLRKGERPAGQLMPQSGLTRAGLSEHLRVLQIAGLIEFRKSGTSLIYRINSSQLRAPKEWLSAFEH